MSSIDLRSLYFHLLHKKNNIIIIYLHFGLDRNVLTHYYRFTQSKFMVTPFRSTVKSLKQIKWVLSSEWTTNKNVYARTGSSNKSKRLITVLITPLIPVIYWLVCRLILSYLLCCVVWKDRSHYTGMSAKESLKNKTP